jgi:hydroxymethylpyrimidine pyrophosphatase-like HAD family hydrolase
VRYKLLAVDVDGTLLRRDGGIHPDDAAAIARLRAGGVPVTIVTGRLYSGTRPVAERLALSGPIACVDGSHIVDLRDDRALVVHTIAGAPAAALRDIVVRHRIASFLFAQDSIVHDAEGEAFAGYVRTWSPSVAVVARVADHPYWDHEEGLLALVGIGGEGDVRAAAEELAARLDHAARVVTFPVARGERHGMHAMVVRAAGPTKGTAIAWLAAHHGCTVAEVVAVGDWINDVPMFTAAGRSFAMGQAPPHVKAMATDHLEADSFDGGGIAEAIRRAFGA